MKTERNSNGWNNSSLPHWMRSDLIPRNPIDYLAHRIEENRKLIKDLDAKVNIWVWRFITAIAAILAATAKIDITSVF